MFTDTAKVSLKAGKGGDGAVSFRHEIYIPKGGPDGGDGGRGGSIIFRADKDTNTLIDFRYNPILTAEDGKNGSGQRSAGRSGKDLIVEVPIGTVVWKLVKDSMNGEREMLADLVKDQQEAVIARGGDGGFGNAHFKSSVRQTPKIAEVGEPGEEFEAELELKLLADVGLVGLPNAGKSTFLSVVSNAKPEIADYPFTTITPNLGVATVDEKDLLIADIPGLIEGASEGKGLGHDFLRHIDRTAVLLHLIDVYSDDAGNAYEIIRHELEKYSDLRNRPEIVALTKCEGLDSEIISMQMANILRENPEAKVYTISSAAHQGIEELLRALKTEVDKSTQTKKEQDQNNSKIGKKSNSPAETDEDSLPVISLSPKAMKDTWTITEDDGVYTVRGEKIEKFARRTDYSNYASLNRLRDIMKKMGIRAELTSMGAKDDSIISIADHQFTLVEEDW
ncbi:GTPase ObgE [Candidatus Saccharibacteria bacterium]|nr:GTPase ObgE [Candidatus Saccharibacteria bacterium]